MNINLLASSILRTPWAMDLQYAHSFLPLVKQILEHGTIIQGENETPRAGIFNVTTSNGLKSMDSKDLEIEEGSVAVINMIGPVIKYGTWCEYGADERVAMLEAVEANDNIIGTVLIQHSGGGAVDGIAPYTNFMATSKKKPIVTLADTSASAAYYVAAHTNYIMAENNISASFGSIGVMVSFLDFAKQMEAMGVKLHTIYAPESDHKNQPYELALEGKYDLIKAEMLSPLARKFQNDVKAHRPNLKLDVPGLLNGKMFYAEEALQYGLIDGIGTLPDAIEKVRELAAVNIFMNK